MIGKRLEVYDAQTKPLIKYYSSAGFAARRRGGCADVDVVFKNIELAVATAHDGKCLAR